MDEGLTNAEADEMIEAFHLFDKDNSGSICSAELKSVLQALGQNPSECEIGRLMREWADEKTGKIEFENYKCLIEKHKLTSDVIKIQLGEAFRIFDKDNSGTINFEELRTCLTSMGEPLTMKEANELVKLADVDGDGCLNLTEFVNLLCEKI